MNDDSGRTPARVDYLFREIGRKLRIGQATCEAQRIAANPVEQEV